MNSPDKQSGKIFNSGSASDLFFRASVGDVLRKFLDEFAGLSEPFFKPVECSNSCRAVFISNELADLVRAKLSTGTCDMAENGIYVFLLRYAAVHRIYVLCKFDDGKIFSLTPTSSAGVNFDRFEGFPADVQVWSCKLADFDNFDL